MMGRGFRFPKLFTRSEHRPSKQRQRALGLPPYHRHLRCEPLEDRRLLTIWTVTNTNDTGEGSLRYEVSSAAAGDTIQFADSLSGKTITLTSGNLSVTKPLTIVGPGPSKLTIKADTSTTYFESVFNVATTANASISGLTVTGGYNENVYNAGKLTITNCAISDATGVSGYGIDFDGHYGGTLAVVGCTVTNNEYYGIYFDATGGAHLTVNSSTLSENEDGIGVWGSTSAQMSCTVNGCAISGNKDEGVYIEYAPSVTIFSTTISENANSGIDNSYGSLTINDCTIGDNGAGTSNYAYQGGGVNNTGAMIVNDSTIAQNSAYYYGGGIYQDSYNGSTTLSNTIIAGNMCGTSYDIYGTVTANYCIVGNTLGANFSSSSADNKSGSPGLAPLGFYGGPTMPDGNQIQTMPPLPSSPAIDAGSNGLIPNGITTDQRGLAANY